MTCCAIWQMPHLAHPLRALCSACPKPPARQTGVVNGEILFLFLNGMHAFFYMFL